MAHALYDDAHIVILSGELDVYRVAEVRQALAPARDKERVVIDMSGVQIISAAVLTEFVRCYKERLKKGYEPARVVAASPHVRRIFEITELAKLWPFYESMDTALSH